MRQPQVLLLPSQPLQVDKDHLHEDYGKNKYKLHYLYREFTVDFFRMDLDSLPENSSSLKFSKHNAHIMSLCLTMHVNLQLSLRKTAQALYDLYGIRISHQQVANYARTAAIVIKPFVDHYEYPKSSVFTQMRLISKSGASKATSGSSWMPLPAPSSATRFQTTALSGHASSPCACFPGHKKTPREVSVHCRRL